MSRFSASILDSIGRRIILVMADTVPASNLDVFRHLGKVNELRLAVIRWIKVVCSKPRRLHQAAIRAPHRSIAHRA
jgi:hypothetical protein